LGPGPQTNTQNKTKADNTPSALTSGRQLLEAVQLITHAVSLGDMKSLLTHPASTTHSTMPAEDRLAASITDGLLRLSVGAESFEDLVADLEEALAKS